MSDSEAIIPFARGGLTHVQSTLGVDPIEDSDPAPQPEEAPDENPVAAASEDIDDLAEAQPKDSGPRNFPQTPEGMPSYFGELRRFHPGRGTAVHVYPDRVDFRVQVGTHKGVETKDEYGQSFSPNNSFALSHALRAWAKYRPGTTPMVDLAPGVYAPLEIGGGNTYRGVFSPDGTPVTAWIRGRRNNRPVIRSGSIKGQVGGADGIIFEAINFRATGGRYCYSSDLGQQQGLIAFLNCSDSTEAPGGYGGRGRRSVFRLDRCQYIVAGCEFSEAEEHHGYISTSGQSGRPCFWVGNSGKFAGRTHLQIADRHLAKNQKGAVVGGPPGGSPVYIASVDVEQVGDDPKQPQGSAITIAGCTASFVHIEDILIRGGFNGAFVNWGSTGHGIHSYDEQDNYLGAFGWLPDLEDQNGNVIKPAHPGVWTPDVTAHAPGTHANEYAYGTPEAEALLVKMRDRGFNSRHVVVKNFRSEMPKSKAAQFTVTGCRLFEHQGVDIGNGQPIRLDDHTYGGPQSNGKVVDLGGIHPTS